MYIPNAFEFSCSNTIHAFLVRYSFAELISVYENELQINHLPFLYDQATQTLRGHIANQNPQRAHLERAEMLKVVFRGPHAYVSPNWYNSTNMVPTWNFESVHVSGTVKLLPQAELIDLLTDLSDHHEQGFDRPWKMQKLSSKALNAMLSAITGFEMHITHIEAKQKLSQNRSLEDRLGVIHGLSQSTDWRSREVAQRMTILEAARSATAEPDHSGE